MLLTTTLLSSLLISVTPDESCSASSAVSHVQTQRSIVETAISNDSFSTLVAALKAADLVGALNAKGPFTVFAPTNDAFAKLPQEQLQMLLKPENKALLQGILTYHVTPGKLSAKQVMAHRNAGTLNGQRLDFSVDDAGVRVDGARVLSADIDCSNGVIHVIDSILLPSSMDLIDTAVGAGSFKTLAAALKAAHLVQALKAEGPFTVFAPTDEAFAALPEGTLASLLKPENRDKLSAILTLHVVPGRLYSEQVASGAVFKSLSGKTLKTGTHEKRVLVNGAQVLKADIEASNGVIHVIDSVLLPE